MGRGFDYGTRFSTAGHPLFCHFQAVHLIDDNDLLIRRAVDRQIAYIKMHVEVMKRKMNVVAVRKTERAAK